MAVLRSTPAIATLRPGDVDAPDSFVEVDLEIPAPHGHDLLVVVRAVSVNPADVKLRTAFAPEEAPKVLGFDAAGVVVATGADVTAFEVGDEVYYAGSITRSGSNSHLQLVDERIVARKPTTLSFAEAAALPLTSITAWETLFVRLGLHRESTGNLLVLGGAGGVGSMVTQLARQLTNLRVICTATRPDSVQWARSLGAHEVIDYHDLRTEVSRVAPEGVHFVFSPFSAGNVQAYADVLVPRGCVVAIDDPVGLDLLPLKAKSQTWHWELMFTVPIQLPQSTEQQQLLTEVAHLVDTGVLRTTMTRQLTSISADSVREAHRLVESGGMIGKVVIAEPD